MPFWEAFWAIVLAGSMVAFAGLAIVVAIGGFFDVKALFRSIDAQHAAKGDDPDAED